MIEKRFTLDDEENGLCRCILVDGEEKPTCEICELLNEEEAIIQRLESDNENLRRENEQLRKENIFLAKQRDYWKGKCDEALETFDIGEATATKITELEKENEQLKQRLENLDLLNKENNSVKLIDGKFFIRK